MGVGPEMGAFLTSDLAPDVRELSVGYIQMWGSNTLAHIAIGGGLSALRLHGWISINVVIGALFFLAAKEIFFDIWMTWLDWFVILDSVWDVSCYAMGLVFMFRIVLGRDAK